MQLKVKRGNVAIIVMLTVWLRAIYSDELSLFRIY